MSFLRIFLCFLNRPEWDNGIMSIYHEKKRTSLLIAIKHLNPRHLSLMHTAVKEAVNNLQTVIPCRFLHLMRVAFHPQIVIPLCGLVLANVIVACAILACCMSQLRTKQMFSPQACYMSE
jgi:ABC-type iron transport system FetAB permease component